MLVRKVYLTVIFRIQPTSVYTIDCIRETIRNGLRYGEIEEWNPRPDKLEKIIRHVPLDVMKKDFADGTWRVYDLTLSNEKDMFCCWPKILNSLKSIYEINFDMAPEGVIYPYGNFTFGEMGNVDQQEMPIGGVAWKRQRRR